jgi:hypothetical protein
LQLLIEAAGATAIIMGQSATSNTIRYYVN